MFKNLFRPDSGLMITMTQITDCIFLSLFWLLGSFPVITLGASTAALYDAVYRGFRKGDKHSWGRFLQSFKGNLKASVLPTVVYLAVFGLCGWGLIRIWNAAVAQQVSMGVFSVAAFAAVLILGILSVLFPVLSRFENSFAALLKNTLFLALANLPRTLLLGLINAAGIVLYVKFVVPLFFLPALGSLLSTWLLEPMFRPYMPEEITEDAA